MTIYCTHDIVYCVQNSAKHCESIHLRRAGVGGRDSSCAGEPGLVRTTWEGDP